jgi:hypothetical protein
VQSLGPTEAGLALKIVPMNRLISCPDSPERRRMESEQRQKSGKNNTQKDDIGRVIRSQSKQMTIIGI